MIRDGSERWKLDGMPVADIEDSVGMPHKLLFINYSLGMGGIETLLLELCRAMKEDGRYDPGVCVFESRGVLQKEFELLGVPVHVIPKQRSRDYLLPLKIRHLVREESYELVHVHNQMAWLYGGIGAILAGKPLIYTEHTFLQKFEPSQQRHMKRFLFWIGKRTSLVSTVARHLMPFLKHDLGIPHSRICNIYNGINPAPYQITIDREQKRRELGLSPQSRIVGIVASLTEAKDHVTLIKALPRVIEDVPEAQLLIVGEGSLEAEVRSLVSALGICEHVHFLGVRRDIPELLQIIDVFTLSSLIEGLPVSLLEAMASGCPIVATCIPGVDELVNEDTGILVPHSSPEQQAAALVRVLKDEELAGALGKAGRRRVLKEFSFTAMIEAYLCCYDDVLNGRTG